MLRSGSFAVNVFIQEHVSDWKRQLGNLNEHKQIAK
jgi:hypothetical protein